MKTLKRRITLPMVLTALILPLVILLIFNGIMRLYMINAARQDLKTTAAVLQNLVRQQTKGVPATVDGDQPVGRALLDQLDELRAIVKATSKATGTDMLLTTSGGRLILPADPASLSLGSRLLASVLNRVGQGIGDGQIAVFRSLEGQYLVTGFPLYPVLGSRSPVLVCLTRYSPTRGFLLITNLLLLGILFAGALISILVTLRTARRIATPLLNLSEFAGQIGRGDFSPIVPDPFCSEVDVLSRQMNDMAQRLAQADHLQQTFLQNASHELRTPLMTIQGYAEGLQSGILPDVGKAASVIGEESRRLNRLVESLLTLSRIENRTAQPEPRVINLPDWLRDQVQRLQGISQKTGKTIQLTSYAGPLPVMVDEDLLEQAVENILSNAVRYAREQVWIRLSTTPDSVSILIQDDGPGIAAEDLPHLFERFYRGRGGQYGLGLAIAHAAVSALHGQLSAINVAAGGALFTITLPGEGSSIRSEK